jgi:hypothetical protein
MQEKAGKGRKSQEKSGKVRKSQEKSGKVRKSQGKARKVRESQKREQQTETTGTTGTTIAILERINHTRHKPVARRLRYTSIRHDGIRRNSIRCRLGRLTNDQRTANTAGLMQTCG